MTIVSTLSRGLEALGLVPSAKSRQLAESLIQESEIGRLESRRATAADLATAEAEESADVLAHRQALEPLRARVDALRDSLNQAELDVAKFAHPRRVAASLAGQRIDRLRSDLRQTASPAIAAFVAELRELLEATYKLRHTVTGVTIENKPVVAWSNEASVQARVTAIRAAIAECSENGTLVYRPLDDGAVAVELDRLRAAIPDVAEAPEKILRLVGAIA